MLYGVILYDVRFSFDDATKRIIRILSGNVSRLAHTEPLFMNNMKFWNSMNLYQIAQFIFNFVKADMSEVFNDMLMYNSDVRHYDTRQSHLLHIPHVSSNQRKITLRYEGPVIWNKLQNTVNINCSLCSFKNNWNCYCGMYKLWNYHWWIISFFMLFQL